MSTVVGSNYDFDLDFIPSTEYPYLILEGTVIQKGKENIIIITPLPGPIDSSAYYRLHFPWTVTGVYGEGVFPVLQLVGIRIKLTKDEVVEVCSFATAHIHK
ncbi:unnamed protein product [Allacma fusca]|uniref:Uncharacterized protein n=1 Tax=Allacma fusca TaxID=39272 RepID=A0A8J2KEC6_9HEXA|nr:unnamed protein product [Allacma fusca]